MQLVASRLGRARIVLVAAAVLAFPLPADAGRTNYGWLFPDEVLPKRGVEIQTWVYERNNTVDATTHETLMWWGALVGVTDQLELVFPTEWIWREVDGNQPNFTLEKFGIEARYRFVKLDPEKPDGFAPLIRIAAKRDVTVRATVDSEANVISSYRAGKFHAQIDLGIVSRITRSSAKFELRPGIGASYAVIDDLRLGVEAFGELPLDGDLKNHRWLGVGPNIAWTHGRFWLSASFLVGVYQIDTAPRAIWGILF